VGSAAEFQLFRRRQPVRVRIFDSHELDPSIFQIEQKHRITRETIKPSDHELCSMQTAQGESFRKFRSIANLLLRAALDLGELADDLPVATVEIVRNCLLLRFQAETALALPSCRNPIIGRAQACRFGSISTELGIPRHVRIHPDSDRMADIATGPFRAKRRNLRANLGCGLINARSAKAGWMRAGRRKGNFLAPPTSAIGTM
jgi:hypothetical protein